MKLVYIRLFFFKPELTKTPASLFKGVVMRKTQKSLLLKVLFPDVANVKNENSHSFETTVVDGGALIHRVRWAKDTSFSKIAFTYFDYIRKNYSNPTVVFDGYEHATTKDHERMRRNSIPQSSLTAIVPENSVPYTQSRYFSLEANKKEFVKFLSGYLLSRGVCVVNCPGDADSEIVRIAINAASQNVGTTAVVADDTDIAVMLLYHHSDEMNDIVLIQPLSDSMWSVKRCQDYIVDIKPHLLFIHGFSGCDQGWRAVAEQLRKNIAQ